jgi:hypothetical protein
MTFKVLYVHMMYEHFPYKYMHLNGKFEIEEGKFA